MGWTFCRGPEDKKSFVAQVLRECYDGERVVALAHSVRGNNLWVAEERTVDGVKSRSIDLFLLSKYDGDWGYKDIHESMGPFQLDCPEKLFKLCPEDSPHANKEWRDKVRESRARAKAEKERRKAFKPGAKVRVKDGVGDVGGDEFTVRDVRRGYVFGHWIYKLKFSQVELVG